MARRPPDAELIVFLDENLDGATLASTLLAARVPVRRLSEEFDRSMEDAAWLPEVTKRGWVVATRDNRIRHRRPSALRSARLARSSSCCGATGFVAR